MVAKHTPLCYHNLGNLSRKRQNFLNKPDSSSSLGFTKNAEKLNGRLAMIGFVSLLAIELLTGKGIIAWITSL